MSAPCLMHLPGEKKKFHRRNVDLTGAIPADTASEKRKNMDISGLLACLLPSLQSREPWPLTSPFRGQLSRGSDQELNNRKGGGEDVNKASWTSEAAR